MKWNIVIDSSCDLTSNKNEEIGLSIVPLTINIGQKQFIDDETMNVDVLLEEMDKEKKDLSTACPSPHAFLEEYKKADYTICITMTSALSGTYNSARIAVDMLLEECPDKKVLLIDSRATATKLVIIREKAIEMINEGKNFEEISEFLQKYNKKVGFVCALGAYDNLVKTGRMSKTSGLLATKLGIRAVAKATEEGVLEVFKKPRGEKNAISEMVEFAKQNKKIEDSIIVITHCNNMQGALNLKAKVMEELNPKIVKILECRGLTTFYTMKNGLILGF